LSVLSGNPDVTGSHRAIEEISLNTWPARQTLLLNGWIVRFADGYTKRANSVYPLCFHPGADLEQTIARAEAFFSEHRLNAVFKLTPFAVPQELDRVLEERGYRCCDACEVMTRDLDEVPAPAPGEARIRDRLDGEWLDAFAAFDGLSPHHRTIAERLLTEAVLRQGFALVFRDGAPVACGLGVIQDETMALYNIVTDPRWRGRGYGKQLMLQLLAWGKRNGAKRAFLQVLRSNEPALALYRKLGFRTAYSYWYRVKPFVPPPDADVSEK